MIDQEKMLCIISANGGTFVEFIQACKKNLSMTYDEAVAWLHHLKEKDLVIEDRQSEEWLGSENRDYKNYFIHFNTFRKN